MNPLRIPLLFYLTRLLLLVMDRSDSVQIALAGLFVGTRYLHGFVYITCNYLSLLRPRYERRHHLDS
jgi:hypothetical protein